MAIYLGNQKIAINTLAPLTPVVLRQDAVVCQTYSLDRMIVEDDEVTLPSYSTSSVSLFSSEALTPTVTLDTDDYYYFIEEKILTTPQYNITTVGKGRQEYSFTIAEYQILDIHAQAAPVFVGAGVNTSSTYILSGRNIFRDIFYSSASALGVYNGSYGIHQTLVAPTLSDTTLTINTPSMAIRGSSTYLTSTYFNAMTDCRRQFLVKVYRVPKNNLNVEGWAIQNMWESISNSIVNNNGTLT